MVKFQAGSNESLKELCEVVKLFLLTFFVRVPPDIISLQLCTPKVVGT
jgi:hypothetical protein